jgi:hypothetical protein
MRDQYGVALASACHFFPRVSDPEGVELLACHRVVEVARVSGVRKLFL